MEYQMRMTYSILSLCTSPSQQSCIVAAGFSSSIIVQPKDPSRRALWTTSWPLLESHSSES
jgi:hypothetical protein